MSAASKKNRSESVPDEIESLLREVLPHTMGGGQDPTAHPDSRVLVEYQEGLLGEEDHAAVSEHLRECKACRESVELLDAAEKEAGDSDAAESQPLWDKVKGALVRLVEIRLPARMQALAAAASWEIRDAPDDELRMDRPGDGPFEAYLQRFGDRLIIAVFFEDSKDVEFMGARDAFTGEHLGATPEIIDRNEYACDLGSARDLRGRRIAAILVAEGKPLRLEVDVGPKGSAKRRR